MTPHRPTTLRFWPGVMTPHRPTTLRFSPGVMTPHRPTTLRFSPRAALAVLTAIGLFAAGACSGSDGPPLSGASTETLVWAATGIVDEFVPALDVDDTLSSGPVTRHAVRQAAAEDRWLEFLGALDERGVDALDLIDTADVAAVPAFAGPLAPAEFTRRLRTTLAEYFRGWVGAPELRAELTDRGVSDDDIDTQVGVIADVLAEDWVDLFRLDLVDALPVAGDRITVDGQLLADVATVLWAAEAIPVFAAYHADDGPLAGNPVILAVVSFRADDRFSTVLSDALAVDDREQQEAILRAAVPAASDLGADLPSLDEAVARIALGEDGDVSVTDSDAAVAEQVSVLVAELFDVTNRMRLEAVISGMSSAYSIAYQYTLLEHAA